MSFILSIFSVGNLLHCFCEDKNCCELLLNTFYSARKLTIIYYLLHATLYSSRHLSIILCSYF
uniref:Uncharacterized protein n=1 Tax=Rhizophora mucronata TaxID=61149 RepID=A0A2P2L5P0_RHIMU